MLHTHDAELCMCVDLPLDKKQWKIRTGPWAAGPCAAWPWVVGRRAFGPWAAGPSGHRGPWAACLLLAKPSFSLV